MHRSVSNAIALATVSNSNQTIFFFLFIFFFFFNCFSLFSRQPFFFVFFFVFFFFELIVSLSQTALCFCFLICFVLMNPRQTYVHALIAIYCSNLILFFIEFWRCSAINFLLQQMLALLLRCALYLGFFICQLL